MQSTDEKVGSILRDMLEVIVDLADFTIPNHNVPQIRENIAILRTRIETEFPSE